MQKHTFIKNCLFFLLLTLLASCDGQTDTSDTGNTADGQPLSEDQAIPEDLTPKGNEEFTMSEGFGDDVRKEKYRELVSGRWINDENKSMTIEFSGETFRRTDNGTTTESAFTIYLDCKTEACMQGDEAPVHGWCFTTDDGCYQIKSASLFDLRLIDFNAGKVMTFKKEEE